MNFIDICEPFYYIFHYACVPFGWCIPANTFIAYAWDRMCTLALFFFSSDFFFMLCCCFCVGRTGTQFLRFKYLFFSPCFCYFRFVFCFIQKKLELDMPYVTCICTRTVLYIPYIIVVWHTHPMILYAYYMYVFYIYKYNIIHLTLYLLYGVVTKTVRKL